MISESLVIQIRDAVNAWYRSEGDGDLHAAIEQAIEPALRAGLRLHDRLNAHQGVDEGDIEAIAAWRRATGWIERRLQKGDYNESNHNQ